MKTAQEICILTSLGHMTPALLSTEANDSINLVFATGSIPFEMISWMQSHALSLS